MRAGEFISIEPGFNVEPGGVFEAHIEDCGTTNDNITASVDVSFSPNGDGVNDFWCINAQNANRYYVSVFSRWGSNFKASGIVPSDGKICLDIDFAHLCLTDSRLYSVYVTLSNCSDDLSWQMYVELDCPGIDYKTDLESLDLLQRIETRPNPFVDHIDVNLFGFNNEEIKYKILDVQGSLQKEEVLEGNIKGFKINTSDLSSGVYMIEVQQGSYTQSKKIIKL